MPIHIDDDNGFGDDNGFRADASYFDLIAEQALNPNDSRDLKQLADAYCAFAKLHHTVGSRREHWMQRAEQCRVMAVRFPSAACFKELQRLADTYEVMADAETARETESALEQDALPPG